MRLALRNRRFAPVWEAVRHKGIFMGRIRAFDGFFSRDAVGCAPFFSPFSPL